jgi:membrane fusion protein (multidrug efflux system)
MTTNPPSQTENKTEDEKKDQEDKQSGDNKEKEDKTGKNGEGKGKPFHLSFLQILIGLIIIIGVSIVGIRYYIYSSDHAYTDDAYTAGHIHMISPRVDGTVVAVMVDDNYKVHQGDVLVQLDQRDFQVRLDKAQADYNRAKADFDRVYKLKDDVAISKQDYDQTHDTLSVATANLEDARDQMSYTTIRAPSDGYIGHKQVEVGNRVTVGGALMAVVQDSWVVANFKETQLGDMKIGQRAEIDIDAIPKHKFFGRIDSFSPGSGSVFALLPPDNATGNFTKIVQRVPVKITFDAESVSGFESRILPGLSVEASIDITEKNPPQPVGPSKFGL